jgi:hypothetical protein
VVSTEDTAEIWEAEAIKKVRGRAERSVLKGRLTRDRRGGGRKVLLAQQTRRLGDKQEDEEDLFFLNLKGPVTVGTGRGSSADLVTPYSTTQGGQR